MREDLTLENVQVDCRNLTEEQIKGMADVFESKGYCYFENDEDYSLSIIGDTSYLHIYEGEIIIDSMVEGLKEITYDKFMELFGEQEVSKPTLSQYFKDLTPIDNPPFIKADSLGYIGQIVDNEEESSAVTPKEIVKYLSKKDIFLTPKQYKKLWKKS